MVKRVIYDGRRGRMEITERAAAFGPTANSTDARALTGHNGRHAETRPPSNER